MQRHPYLTAQLAAEHVRDMRAQAAEARYAREARHARRAAAELHALAVRDHGRLSAAGRMQLRQDAGHLNAGGLRRDEELRTGAASTGQQRLTEAGHAIAGERETTCCCVTGDKLRVRGTLGGERGESCTVPAGGPTRPAPGMPAMTSSAPGSAGLAQVRHLEKMGGWTRRERLGFLWYRRRLTAREMNHATRRVAELRMRLP